MAPTNKAQHTPALHAISSHLFILIAISLLISIVLIKRFSKPRLQGLPSGDTKQKASHPNLVEKHIKVNKHDESITPHPPASTTLPYRRTEHLGTNDCLSTDQAPKLKSPSKISAQLSTSDCAQIQLQYQHGDHEPIALSPPPPLSLDLDLQRAMTGNSQAPSQVTMPAPHWQTEGSAHFGDDTPSNHSHPFGSLVMQIPAVDFPQIQRETVQFLPRAGPDKRQAWRRRVLECN
ncbi:hypothetical protein PAAG_08673 [Paracoccidioides lutzii Pb01]|uniref:Uncharacterized protein n=1 Tax=Paracoccidioides lutzii (strain ATCC MYA-826 / Pb01) TaxID=502779 RepID=C1HD32_PARBA|nr:hypothetical protein PAAG_08673 [Paracoccidioides lutzii Pb01]EEH39404.1 hypothetical protein PAAG_08673 [Paracoccidioides lutzii Pb01]